MPEPSPPTGSPLSSNNDRPRTPWAVHAVCYVLLCVLFFYVLAWRYARPMVFQERIGVERGTGQELALGDLSGEVETKIDPNIASWVELDAFLPGIGEVTAKRIIAFRQARQANATADSAGRRGASVVFTCPEDLQAVRGIGPKTVDRIAPHLIFGGSPSSRPTD